MNNIFIHLCLISTIMVLNGCSRDMATTASTEQQALNEVLAPYAQAAITVNITATPDLNAWNDIANSCSLLVIQAQKSSSLSNVLANPAQLKTLFSGAGSEDEILKVDRYPVMPGQRTTLHIDRTENTRYVAIVAGYYPFPKKQHMAIVSIPVITASEGWWDKKWSAEMVTLVLNVTLGSQSITQLTTMSPQTDTDPLAKFAEQKEENKRQSETGVK